MDVLHFCYYKLNRKIKIKVASRFAEVQSVTVNSTGCGFPTRWNEILIYIYIFISPIWCLGKVRYWVPRINTQCLQNLTESGDSLTMLLGIQREVKLIKEKKIVFLSRKIVITFKINEPKLKMINFLTPYLIDDMLTKNRSNNFI